MSLIYGRKTSVFVPLYSLVTIVNINYVKFIPEFHFMFDLLLMKINLSK
jgi:hypothetical protein